MMRCIGIHQSERRQGMEVNTAGISRWSVRGLARLLLIGFVVSCVFGLTPSAAWSAPPPKAGDILAFKPRQDGVDYSTPARADQAQCKVVPDNGRGWILKDGQGKTLRRFTDAAGTGRINRW